ncbi:hypothetical protein RB195_003212 [Necator americanus]|uniref:Uncharacterized protein n=1 Tax=Necator americanus TaxID=51031 RepID=A0ABR1DML6_NECAM
MTAMVKAQFMLDGFCCANDRVCKTKLATAGTLSTGDLSTKLSSKRSASVPCMPSTAVSDVEQFGPTSEPFCNHPDISSVRGEKSQLKCRRVLILDQGENENLANETVLGFTFAA